jgi:hypothetical protein
VGSVTRVSGVAPAHTVFALTPLPGRDPRLPVVGAHLLHSVRWRDGSRESINDQWSRRSPRPSHRSNSASSRYWLSFEAPASNNAGWARTRNAISGWTAASMSSTTARILLVGAASPILNCRLPLRRDT